MISCLVLLGAGQFLIYIKKTMIMVVFCYVITIPLTEYRERGWGGLLWNTCGGCLTIFFSFY